MKPRSKSQTDSATELITLDQVRCKLEFDAFGKSIDQEEFARTRNLQLSALDASRDLEEKKKLLEVSAFERFDDIVDARVDAQLDDDATLAEIGSDGVDRVRNGTSGRSRRRVRRKAKNAFDFDCFNLSRVQRRYGKNLAAGTVGLSRVPANGLLVSNPAALIDQAAWEFAMTVIGEVIGRMGTNTPSSWVSDKWIGRGVSQHEVRSREFVAETLWHLSPMRMRDQFRVYRKRRSVSDPYLRRSSLIGPGREGAVFSDRPRPQELLDTHQPYFYACLEERRPSLGLSPFGGPVTATMTQAWSVEYVPSVSTQPVKEALVAYWHALMAVFDIQVRQAEDGIAAEFRLQQEAELRQEAQALAVEEERKKRLADGRARLEQD